MTGFGLENGTTSSSDSESGRESALRGWSSSELAHKAYRFCDNFTGGLLYCMVIFGPWAFGTTQPWAIQVMNAAGYALGAILLLKWALRRITGFKPSMWGASADHGSAASSWTLRSLGILTFLLLAYCLVSALNARSTLTADYLQLQYRQCITWLPHSYDATMTWQAFWKYLGLAAVFWAARDWLIVKSRADRANLREEGANLLLERGCFIPRRLEILLWIICLNGAVLAAEGLLQRALGDGKLLFIIEPHINKTAESQFGPYAYRSNAAQYLLLVWPMAVGFWWLLRRRAHTVSTRLKPHNNLLPCILIMGLVPLMSLSRAGAVIGGLSLLAVGELVLSNMTRHRKAFWGIGALLGAALLLGSYMEWQRLDTRFRQESLDSSRFEIWRDTWEIVQDFPVYGTGPGTFSSVYQWYRPSAYDEWYAFAHNDWLEALVTFGALGSALILLALILVFALRLTTKGIDLHRLFAQTVYVGLGSCLLYAVGDFPFQVHSVVFLFVLECAILSCLSRAGIATKKATGF